MRIPTAAIALGFCLLCWIPSHVSACGSCLGSLALSSVGISRAKSAAATRSGASHHPRAQASSTSGKSISGAGKIAPTSPVSKSALCLLAIRQILARNHWKVMLKSRVFASSEADPDARTSTNDESSDSDALEDMLSDDNYETPEQRGVDPEYMARSKEGRMTAGMTGAIGFYKGWISPILPPACRFVPTCSQYGVQAIQEFGPAKGSLLTAWRLMRCSPFGGKGYDPPRWPPVPFTYSSY